MFFICFSSVIKLHWKRVLVQSQLERTHETRSINLVDNAPIIYAWLNIQKLLLSGWARAGLKITAAVIKCFTFGAAAVKQIVVNSSSTILDIDLHVCGTRQWTPSISPLCLFLFVCVSSLRTCASVFKWWTRVQPNMEICNQYHRKNQQIIYQMEIVDWTIARTH